MRDGRTKKVWQVAQYRQHKGINEIKKKLYTNISAKFVLA